MSESFEIPPLSARAFAVNAGQTVRIIDTRGGQPGDLVVFKADDYSVRFSQARTRVENGVYRLTEGHCLWSNSQPPAVMMRAVRDTAGGHDLLYAACCRYALEKRFNLAADGCLEHLEQALAQYHIPARDIPEPLNLFFRVEAAAGGTVTIRPPVSKAGDYIELRAEMDCLIAVSACSVPQEGRTNSGYRIEI